VSDLCALSLYTLERDRAPAFLYGVSPGAAALAYDAMTRWLLGFPQRALQRSRDAVALAQATRYPASLDPPLARGAWLYQFCREAPGVQAQAEALLPLAHEQGVPFWVAVATISCGWALTAQGQVGAGVARIRQGLAAYHATGAAMRQTCLRALLVEGYGNGGRLIAGCACWLRSWRRSRAQGSACGRRRRCSTSWRDGACRAAIEDAGFAEGEGVSSNGLVPLEAWSIIR
jgi:hypothetical protein